MAFCEKTVLGISFWSNQLTAEISSFPIGIFKFLWPSQCIWTLLRPLTRPCKLLNDFGMSLKLEMTLELFCTQIEPDKFYKTLSLTKHKEEVEECNVALSLLCCQQPTIFCSSAKICLPEVHYFEVSSFHFLSCTTLFINTFSEWVHTKRYYLCKIEKI